MPYESGEQPIAPEALERVRRELAELGSDVASAPDVPADVTARIGAALHAAGPGPAAHAVGRPPLRRYQRLGLALGLCATVLAIAGGVLMLVRDQAPAARSTGPTANSITVSRLPGDIPLSDAQMIGLLSQDPDYGALADPQRRASCLSSLGYPAATPVLGAQPVDMRGRAGVLMLLPGDTPKAIVALVVEPNCSAAHTGLLASTEVTRP